MLTFISNATSTAVRVGYTTDPYALLVRLLAVHGDDLRLLSVVNGGQIADAFLHALFADDHIEDGWLKPSALLTALIEHLDGTTYDDDEADWALSLAYMVKDPAKVALETARVEAEAAAKPPKKPILFRKASEYAEEARAKAYDEAMARAKARRQRRKAA
jgi:hypothetical protein